MYNALKRLALDPRARALYAKNKTSFIAPHIDLRPTERRALLSHKAFMVNWSMKADLATVTDDFVRRLLQDPTFAKQWSTEVKTCPKESPEAFKLHIHDWLYSKGFDITEEDVKAGWAQEKSHPLNLFANTYNTQVDGTDGPMLVIRAGTVSWGKVNIQDFSFSSGKLSWTQSSTNPNTAELDFVILANDQEKPLPKESYIGLYFSGTIDTDGITSQVTGRVGDFPSNPSLHPTDSTKLSQYNSTYTVYIKSAHGEWEKSDHEFVVDHPTVTYQGNTLKNFAWTRNSVLTASTKHGNAWNISIHFYTLNKSTENQVLGTHFYGRRWAADESPPSPNFMGMIGGTPNPKSESDSAFRRSQSIVSAMNAVNSVLSWSVFVGTANLVEKIAAWQRNPTPETQKEMEEAKQELDHAIRAEGDVGLQEVAENLEGDNVCSDPDLVFEYPEPQTADEVEVVTDELGPFVDVDIVFIGASD